MMADVKVLSMYLLSSSLSLSLSLSLSCLLPLPIEHQQVWEYQRFRPGLSTALSAVNMLPHQHIAMVFCLFIVWRRWLLVAVVGTPEALRLSAHLSDTLRADPLNPWSASWANSFRNNTFKNRHVTSSDFLWKALFKCPPVTDGLIICKNVLLTLWGQPCFT